MITIIKHAYYTSAKQKIFLPKIMQNLKKNKKICIIEYFVCAILYTALITGCNDKKYCLLFKCPLHKYIFINFIPCFTEFNFKLDICLILNLKKKGCVTFLHEINLGHSHSAAITERGVKISVVEDVHLQLAISI